MSRSLPFGVFLAPVWAFAREVVLPAALGLAVGAFGAGWFLRGRK